MLVRGCLILRRVIHQILIMHTKVIVCLGKGFILYAIIFFPRCRLDFGAFHDGKSISDDAGSAQIMMENVYAKKYVFCNKYMQSFL